MSCARGISLRAKLTAWMALGFLVIAAIAAPFPSGSDGQTGLTEPMVTEMADGADRAHGADCCPEGAHAPGAGCLACLLSLAALPGVALGSGAEHQPVRDATARSIRLGGPDVPHGPPRFV